MRLVEAESSSTLMLGPAAALTLHCVGDAQSRPVWYYNDQTLDAGPQTLIAVRVDRTSNTRESILTRTGPAVDGQYQCRDASGYQADSDSLLVF